MDNIDNILTLLDTVNDMMIKIDSPPWYPRNKLLHCHHFVVSKLSWHLTIADLSKTWVVGNVDNIVLSYVMEWLELPINATFSYLILNKSRYGISLVLSSTNFVKFQTARPYNFLQTLKSNLFGQKLATVRPTST